MIFLISSACFDIHFLQIDCRVDALYGTWYAVGLFVIASSTVFVEVSLQRILGELRRYLAPGTSRSFWSQLSERLYCT